MNINQVAILGSGVMGAQIAAVFANANIPTLLFGYQDCVQDDLDNIASFKPKALTRPEQQNWITAASFEDDLAQLSHCDLVIEVIIEDITAKQALFAQVLPYLSENVILATNTSSLCVNEIAKNLGNFQQQFCGIHFFNPPRYMPLLELIATEQTKPELLDVLEGFFTSELGKNILRAKDKTGFIANRIGVFSIAACIHHAQRLKLDFDTVDALTGRQLKRSKSATFRTADLVGLDILKHVLNQFNQTLINDPWHNYFDLPEWLDTLLEQGALGEKTKAGLYKKKAGEIMTYHPESATYHQVNYTIDKTVKAIFASHISGWIAAFKENPHPHSQFLYAIIKDTCLYSAYHLQDIADSTRDIDWSLHWGFGWEVGIFELWQANGVAASLALFQADDSNAVVADWVGNIDKFYTDQGAYTPVDKTYTPYSEHTVYQRQLYRPALMGEQTNTVEVIIFENESVKYFHQQDGFAILSLKTKLHTLNLEVIESIKQAVEIAEKDFKALIIWQQQQPFCAGANLYEIVAAAKLGMIETENLLTKIKKQAWQLSNPTLPSIKNLKPINEVIEQLQQALMALKYSKIPTIAAVDGLALGGGCEMLLYCNSRVVYAESYIGLVEAGVGLLPAGGGCCEMARRAAKQSKPADIFPILAQYFAQIGMAKISESAVSAVDMGYLDAQDVIVAQRLELLYFAKQQAQSMLASHYRPDDPNQSFKIAGSTAKANILAQLNNMKIGKFISEYDEHIAKKIADVLCGGELAGDTEVDSQYLLDLEKTHFIELLTQEKTQQRIEYMLKKHKPLRN
ncbi:Enoyl-CoA hydratase / 3,2-trans-enoyl-CoA isomerase / 3-hydroxyacyl-CoA dehydrogenase [uncultured Candidatus Thioglobus sp.]|nr:Enoyl-CoA hydratase / 3,2-trans-enoyl-CoA isomerase / 3-hydroxyacyl-CoA dehydrogenase [uncultured Candidatus Thioglobus sp.]